MRNVPIPDREEDFTADPAELFFDLSFVFAFSRLVFHLVHYPTLEGFGEFVLLFLLIWVAWSNFTWSANAVAGNSRFVRLIFMGATAISLPMAASLEDPFGNGSVVFAATVSVILAMPIVAGTNLMNDEAINESNKRYLAITVAGIALLVAGGFADGGLQLSLWIGAAAVLVINTIDAGGGNWLVRPGHFAERHGLIVIIALGEVIVAIGAPVVGTLSEGENLDGVLVAALTASGALACLLWWSYFDRPLPALEHRHEQLVESTARSRFARDVYTYNHFFIVSGILLTAAALEEIMLHPSDHLPGEYRAMLLGGLALYLSAVVASVVRAFRKLAVERLVAVVAIGGLVGAAASIDGVWLLIGVDLVLLVALAVEHVRVEGANQPVLAGATSPAAGDSGGGSGS